MKLIWAAIISLACTSTFAQTARSSTEKTLSVAPVSVNQESAAAAQASAIFYDTNPAAKLLHYEVINPLVSHLGPISLELYGDGRMVVVRPAFLKNPGTYETRLSVEEVSNLLASLLDTGMTEAAAKAPEEKKQNPNEQIIVADGDIVSLEFSLLQEKSGEPMTTLAGQAKQTAPQVHASLPQSGAQTQALARADRLLRPRALDLSSMTKVGAAE